MGRDIWILWMGSLKEDSHILDLDAIEDYLGPNGLKLVDFGIYTWDADENEAIKEARPAQGDRGASQGRDGGRRGEPGRRG